jgi:hypothetical protein
VNGIDPFGYFDLFDKARNISIDFPAGYVALNLTTKDAKHANGDCIDLHLRIEGRINLIKVIALVLMSETGPAAPFNAETVGFLIERIFGTYADIRGGAAGKVRICKTKCGLCYDKPKLCARASTAVQAGVPISSLALVFPQVRLLPVWMQALIFGYRLNAGADLCYNLRNGEASLDLNVELNPVIVGGGLSIGAQLAKPALGWVMKKVFTDINLEKEFYLGSIDSLPKLTTAYQCDQGIGGVGGGTFPRDWVPPVPRVAFD